MKTIKSLYLDLSQKDCQCTHKQNALNVLRNNLCNELKKEGLDCTAQNALVTAKKYLKEHKAL